MPNVGDRKTVEYEYRQKECSVCESPATHRITYLLENARSNPASSGYRGDDISYCSDSEDFACDKHNREVRDDAPRGMRFCADWYVSKNEDGTFRNLDRVCSWEEIK